MGLVRGNFLPILKEHYLRPFSGHCLCLGQADVYFTYENLQSMAKIAQIQLSDTPVTLSYRPDFAIKGYISRDTLFKAIGFSEVFALDRSDFEGAEYIFDLNSPDAPETLKEKFDLVVDHGTMEHVFHTPNFLANIHAMLKIGGRVIHANPSSNWLDHGFYMFSPTLYQDFYSANRWNIHTIQVTRGNPKYQEIDAPFFADYEPGIFDHLSSGGLDASSYGTLCIAEKSKDSTSNVIPQQGYYRHLGDWEQNVSPETLVQILLKPPFVHENKYCWKKDLRKFGIRPGDGIKNPRISPLILLENDTILKPPHTLHDLVRNYGKGCYSHWEEALYFSTSDNTNPNTNGRKYYIKTAKQP